MLALLALLAASAASALTLTANPASPAPASTAVSTTTAPTAAPIHLLSSTPEELREHFGWPALDANKLATKTDKALNLWKSLRKGIDVLNEDSNSLKEAKLVPPVLRRELAAPDVCHPIASAVLTMEHASSDGTIKLLLTLADGLSVECVLIPISSRHTSLCVSSQIGCSRACAFCSTGTMGLVRNLTPEEILTQLWIAQRYVREQALPPLVNIVFMGMGEPLNNLNSVARAVELMTDPGAFALSPRQVTVSTVGPSPTAIRAAAARLPCRMAWSVHAADDGLRKLLVPTTAHPMADLRDAFVDALGAKPERLRGLVVELTMIRGVNDGEEHGFGRQQLLVNLIPYNDNGLGLPGGAAFEASPLEAVRAFQRRMWDQGVLCTVRATRGDDERSACGQLATEAGRLAPR